MVCRAIEDFKSSEPVDVSQSGVTCSHPISDPISLHLPYGTEFPPDLAAIVDAWPDLPDAIKAGILARIKASQQGDLYPISSK